jgi:hypothetical protein
LISSRNVVEYESYRESHSQRRNPSNPQLGAEQARPSQTIYRKLRVNIGTDNQELRRQ